MSAPGDADAVRFTGHLLDDGLLLDAFPGLTTRRSRFTLLRGITEFCYEEFYEDVISQIISDGESKAERFRYATPRRWAKAWLIVAKTHGNVLLAIWSGGLEAVVGVIVRAVR